LGVPILCLGVALLVFSSLVVLNSGGVSYQRIPLCITLGVLWKRMAARRVGFSGTSNLTIPRPHYSKFNRLILFHQRVLLLDSRISASANFNINTELTRDG